jgi:hypothetical protein
MIKVPINEIRARYQTVPKRLQDKLALPETDAFLDSVYAEFRIPAKKISSVARTVGLVFLGFLRTDQFSSELEERAKLDPLTAKAAAKKISDGLFKDIQSDLDLVYAPPGAAPVAIPTAPVSAPAAFAPMPPPGGSAFGRTAPAFSGSGPAPKAIFNIEATPFTKTGAPGSPSIPGTPPPSSPAPIFLRKEEGIRPVETKSTGLRFNFSNLKIQDAKQSAPAPQRATLEIGQGPSILKPSGPAHLDATPAKVVHYSEWTPPSSKPAGDSKPEEKPVPLTNLGMNRPFSGGSVPVMANGPTSEERKSAFISNITGRTAGSVPPPAVSIPASTPLAPTSTPQIPVQPAVPAAPPVQKPFVPSAVISTAPPAPRPIAPSSTIPSAPVASAAGEVVDLGSF